MSDPYLLTNTFSTFHLTEEQQLQSAILTDLQRCHLQNQLAAIAEEKIRLEYDPANPETFIQQEAYKRGQLDILSYLLELSETANNEVNKP